jgi:hypothetical protein
MPGTARTTRTPTRRTGAGTEGTGTTATGATGAAYTVSTELERSSRVCPVGAVTVTPNTIEPVRAPSVIDVTVTVPPSYVYAATAPGTSVSPTYTLTDPVAATVAVEPWTVSGTDVYVDPAVGAPPVHATASPVGHVYVALAGWSSTAAYFRVYSLVVPTLNVRAAV